MKAPRPFPPLATGPRKGSAGAHRHPRADTKGKAGGVNSVPPEARTHSPHRLRQLPAVLGRPLLPAPCPLLPEHFGHFSLGQCHQDRKADTCRDQVQEGRL